MSVPTATEDLVRMGNLSKLGDCDEQASVAAEATWDLTGLAGGVYPCTLLLRGDQDWYGKQGDSEVAFGSVKWAIKAGGVWTMTADTEDEMHLRLARVTADGTVTAMRADSL